MPDTISRITDTLANQTFIYYDALDRSWHVWVWQGARFIRQIKGARSVQRALEMANAAQEGMGTP